MVRKTVVQTEFEGIRFINVQSRNNPLGRELKVKYDELVGLDGIKRPGVKAVGDGSIIVRFDKTPHPQSPTDVVCPHFLELKWANGCYFSCSWCYLNGTYRFRPEWKNGKPNIKDYNVIESHVKAFITQDGIRPELLNSGELSDSLLTEATDNPFSRFIVDALDKFDTVKKHKVLFLTKSANVKNIVNLNRPDRIIMSFTLNAEKVARRWEKKAPPIKTRLSAIEKVFNAGYTTRIRIDPMVPIDNWREQYQGLIDSVFSKIIPERITLGSLRGLSTTIRMSKDKSWVPYMTEKSNWGKKVDFKKRLEMYSELIDYLNTKHDYTKVALCKETLDIWEHLGLDHKKPMCNCMI